VETREKEIRSRREWSGGGSPLRIVAVPAGAALRR
jgi:hypothetical protein